MFHSGRASAPRWGFVARFMSAYGMFGCLITACIALTCASASRAQASATADTTFAGDWQHGGRILWDWPGTANAAGFIVGADGFYGLWDVPALGASHLRLTRTSFAGTPSAGWPAEGIVVCDDTTGQSAPHLVSDGGNGVFVSWQDARDSSRVRLQHVLENGSLAPGWPTDGRPVPGGRRPIRYRIVADLSGGLLIAWESGEVDLRDNSIYVTKLLANATVDPAWPADGLLVIDGDGSHYPTSSIAYTMNSLHPGLNGSAWIGYSSNSSCSGHCNPNDYLTVKCIGVSGLISGVTDSADIQWRYTYGDGVGGIYDYWKWMGDVILERRDLRVAVGALWYLTVPPDMGLLVDSVHGVYGQIGNRLYHYGADGTPNPDWGGASGYSPVTPPGSYALHFALDGAGGGLAIWEDYRTYPAGGPDLYAAYLQSDGSLTSGWPAAGLPVVTSTPGLVYRGMLSIGDRRTIVLWTAPDRLDRTYWGQALSPNQPVPVQASLVSSAATPNRVSLRWFAPGSSNERLTVERRDEGDWRSIGECTSDGSGNFDFEDERIEPGRDYSYRLSDGRSSWGFATVSVPSAWRLAMAAPAGNPVREVASLRLTMPDDRPVNLSVFDVGGRRVAHWPGLRAGAGERRHDIDVRRWAPGVYLCRLDCGSERRLTRFVVAH